MKGIHVFYPNRYRNGMYWDSKEKKFMNDPGSKDPNYHPYVLHDFDVIVAYLSVLNWKKYNGEIELYTNEEGLEIFEKLGLAPLYDKIDVKIIDEQIQKNNISTNIFWAGYKLMVLSQLKAPFVVLDLDFYAELSFEDIGFFDKDMGLFHFEEKSLTYPFPPVLKGYDQVDWPQNWDWKSHAVNVALLYFGNQKALEEYTSIALDYMNDNSEGSIYEQFNTRMTFAEQRILGEFVEKSEYTTDVLITGLYYPLYANDNCIGFRDVKNLRNGIFRETDHGLHKHSNITNASLKLNHLWGYKAMLLKNKMDRANFVVRLTEKMERDFPEHYDQLNRGLINWYNDRIK